MSLTESVAAVWSTVTGAPVHLARLAADACGDAHALDSDRPLGRAVARLAATVHGLPRPSRSGPSWRAAWAAVGVLCNEVSSRVLTLNLPLRGDAAAVALATAAPGEPTWLTLRSLSGRWTAASETPVYVCENPTIVEAAADVLGARCSPLVCTDGIASSAALSLVGGLVEAGCAIHARADFDRAGLTILDQLRTVAPDLSLWRFDLETYTAILGSGSTAVQGDFEASMLMRPVHEETALPLLLTDLDPAMERPDDPDLQEQAEGAS